MQLGVNRPVNRRKETPARLERQVGTRLGASCVLCYRAWDLFSGPWDASQGLKAEEWYKSDFHLI